MLKYNTYNFNPKCEVGYSHVYLLQLTKLIKNVGVRYLKVGVTKFQDSLSRLTYNHQMFLKGIDKSVDTSIINHFEGISVLCFKKFPEHVSLQVEKDVLKLWGNRDCSFVQNFKGITEVRIYSEEKLQKTLNLIRQYRYEH